jgi:hypothetical protein
MIAVRTYTLHSMLKLELNHKFKGGNIPFDKENLDDAWMLASNPQRHKEHPSCDGMMYT